MALKIFYMILIGLLMSLFIGLGVATFYEGPIPPESVRYFPVYEEGKTPNSNEMSQQQKEYDKAYAQYLDEEEVYNRNVSLIILGFAVVIAVGSIFLSKKLLIIGDALLLGSVFLLVYSIIRGFSGDDNRFRFLVTTVGFVMALAIGYVKFLKKEEGEFSKK